jgi:CMP-N,N'-diacetyllegionaminic acid synthase
MKSLGVIVARGGSKRVHRKALRPLAGHPVIAWMVRAALNSRVDRLVLSTEDAEIAEVARSYGADTPFQRSSELARDDSRNDAVLLDALDQIEQMDGVTYDATVLLQSTAPFTQPDHIDACVSTLAEGDANCVFTARPVREPPGWMFRENADGMAQSFLGDELIGERRLTRLHERVLLPSGSVWAVRSEALRVRETVYAPPLRMFEVPLECSVDLDEEIDFLLAEATAAHYGFTLMDAPGQ